MTDLSLSVLTILLVGYRSPIYRYNYRFFIYCQISRPKTYRSTHKPCLRAGNTAVKTTTVHADWFGASVLRPPIGTFRPDMELGLGHWVNGSFGSSFTSGSPGHHIDPVWDPSFPGFRKTQDKDMKICIFLWKSVQPSVKYWHLINNLQNFTFYFPEACKRQTAIKTGKPLTHCKRLSAT